MPTQLTDLAGIFRRAADVIDRNGLAKGDYIQRSDYHVVPPYKLPGAGETRPVCMAGGIIVAVRELDVPDSLVNDAIRFVAEYIGGEPTIGEDGEFDYVEVLADWNDRPERTAAEVSARLHVIALVADCETAKAVA